MRTRALQKLWLAATVTVAASLGPALALPGEASSLRETHGDWTVSCVRQEAATLCAMSQIQAEPKSRKRVLTVELQAQANGTAKGVLIMPFGLALKPGVSLKIDDKETAAPLAYATCLPVGCIVPLTVDTSLLSALKAGGTLNINATSNGDNQSLAFTVSLTGFSAAFARLVELAEE